MAPHFFIYFLRSKTTKNLLWFRNCWEKCEKFCSQKRVQNKSLSSSILLTCKNFSGCTFFKWFPQIWNQRKILHSFDTHMPKKNIKNWSHLVHFWVFLELVECKFARNGLTNWKTFLTDIFKNIIWHLWVPSSCENHCNLVGNLMVVKRWWLQQWYCDKR